VEVHEGHRRVTPTSERFGSEFFGASSLPGSGYRKNEGQGAIAKAAEILLLTTRTLRQIRVKFHDG
jgi:hypothetical protein